MKKTRLLLTLFASLALVLFGTGAACNKNKDTKTGVQTGLNDAIAGLDAHAKALDVALTYGDISLNDYKAQVAFNERIRTLIDQASAKNSTGFEKKDFLGKLDEILTEFGKAESGLNINNAESKARFQAIIAFGKFGTGLARSFVMQIKPPDPPDEVKTEQAIRSNRAGVRSASTANTLAKITEYVTVAQEWAFRALNFHQTTDFVTLQTDFNDISTNLAATNSVRAAK